MKKYFIRFIVLFIVAFFGYFAFIYYVPYSEGVRSGELIKFSKKGVTFKTWEGEMSQGISGAQIFQFTVPAKEKEVITKMENLQGRYVKLTYVERYRTFSWWGDTRYFVTAVEEEQSPFINPK
ncbi:MAG: 6-phosphogluconate dehydrogenase [Bacteroidetes bacterium HGW-Bacteroidetes-23]|nr:MAG: 6-phosphogluconate dehydrogenase [Bacteroidetes bacterium HGW-Bacteroidetes-23]